MENQQPLFSVIVPIYKVENFIDRCIKSILEQSFNDFELLLIDDGSPDKSGEICDWYARKDKRIYVTHATNGGVSKARNIGIKQSKGRYLLFVDADDTLYDDTTLEYLAKNVLNIKADIYQFIIANKLNDAISYSTSLKNVQLFNMYNYKHIKLARGNAVSYVFDNYIIQKYNIIFPEGVRISEDQAFTYSVLTYCNNIAIFPRPCYIYHLGENINNSNSRRNDFEDVKHHLNATAHILNHLNRCNKNHRFINERIAMMILYLANLFQSLSGKEIKSFNTLFKQNIPFHWGYILNNKWLFVIAAYIDLRLETWLYRVYRKL